MCWYVTLPRLTAVQFVVCVCRLRLQCMWIASEGIPSRCVGVTPTAIRSSIQCCMGHVRVTPTKIVVHHC